MRVSESEAKKKKKLKLDQKQRTINSLQTKLAQTK